MSARRTTVILLSLLLADTACARLFPASKQDEPLVRVTRATVEKDVSRRREGADVTVRREPEANWPVRILAPCDSLAPRSPGGMDCRNVDQKVDTLRAPIDTATRKRP
jgi:hypothetical protein